MIPLMATTPSEEIEATNVTACGIMMTVRTEGESAGENLQTKISELLSTEMLFNKGTAPYPMLWAELQKCLSSLNVPLQIHSGHGAVFNTTIIIRVSDEGKVKAIELANCIIKGTTFQKGTIV